MKRIFNLLASVAIMTGVLFSCQAPQQKSTLDKIKETKTLTVATSGNQFPFSFKDGEEFKGIDIKIAEEIAKRMGIEVKFVQYELGDIIAAVNSGKADIAISGLSITAKRNMDVLFAGPYFETGKSILSSDKEIQTGSAEFVNKAEVKLAVVVGSSSEAYVKQHFPNATLMTYEGLHECRDAVYNGEVHGMLADYEICEAYSYDKRNLGDFGFRMISSVDEQDLIGIAVNPNDIHLQNLINNLIKHIRKGKVEEAVELTWMMYLN
jgi:ABC-type amino acid transport substrate-binding protein